jgi:hypothetical protein
MRTKKWIRVAYIKIAYIIAFFTLVAMPAVNINFEPGAVSEKEKRPLAEFPVIFKENGAPDSEGDIRSGFEKKTAAIP